MFLLNPLVFIIICLVIIYLIRNKTGFIVCLICFYLLSIPAGINALIQIKEAAYPPLLPGKLDAQQRYHILVLGAGKNDDKRLEGNQRLSSQALARLVEGIKWMRVLPYAFLIGSGPVGGGDKSQAQLMKETAILLGVDEARIGLQESVYNTRTEAGAYVAQFGTETSLIICTSALHMPRAVETFELYGVQHIMAAPASYLVPAEELKLRHWIPNIDTFQRWQTYLKEVVGLLLTDKLMRQV